MFVWLFHRISGVLLVVLLPIQILTGVLQASSHPTARVIRDVHAHGLLNIVLAFLVIFHGVYGVRAILLDMGIKHERLLFWICTALGFVLFLGFLALLLFFSLLLLLFLFLLSLFLQLLQGQLQVVLGVHVVGLEPQRFLVGGDGLEPILGVKIGVA